MIKIDNSNLEIGSFEEFDPNSPDIKIERQIKVADKNRLTTFSGYLIRNLSEKDLDTTYSNNYEINETILKVARYFNSFPFSYDTMEIVEKLIRSTKVKSLIQDFYKNIGGVNFVPDLKDDEELISDSINSGRYLFNSSIDYDVLDVIEELVNNHVSINIDREMSPTDDYKSITKLQVDYSSSNIVHTYSDWVKVIDASGNKVRANLNLTYLTKIDVQVESGEVESMEAIRNLCIIKDGFLWKKTLIAKLPEDLYTNLAKNGVEISKLCEDSYLIKLYSVPMVKKSRCSLKPEELFDPWKQEIHCEALIDNLKRNNQSLVTTPAATTQEDKLKIKYKKAPSKTNEKTENEKSIKGIVVSAMVLGDLNCSKSYKARLNTLSTLLTTQKPEEIYQDLKKDLRLQKRRKVYSKIVLQVISTGMSSLYSQDIDDRIKITTTRKQACGIPKITYKW